MSVAELTPKSLDELLELSVEDVSRVDIARANLLCAVGLPGAEEVDVEQHVQRIDIWTERVRERTEAFLPAFYENQAEFDATEPQWRLLVFAKVVGEECGVDYHMERIHTEPDWTDSKDLFLHGITGERRMGTCPSLPVLVVAICRRLRYPVYLSHTVGHCFSRWDGTGHENASWNEYFNIEFSKAISFHADEHYYDFPVCWPERSRQAHGSGDPKLEYLYSCTPAQEFAHSLFQRAVCLEALGKHTEAAAICNACKSYDNVWKGYQDFEKRALRGKAEKVMRELGFEPRELRTLLREQAREHIMPNAHDHVRHHAELPGVVVRTPVQHQPEVTYTSPGMALLTKQHSQLQNNPSAASTPPLKAMEIAQLILTRTCEGTAIEPTFDLLMPHPPEPKVDPYAKLRDKTGRVKIPN